MLGFPLAYKGVMEFNVFLSFHLWFVLHNLHAYFSKTLQIIHSNTGL